MESDAELYAVSAGSSEVLFRLQMGFAYVFRAQAFAERLADSPIRGFDLLHQIARFRNSRNVPAAEVSLILQTLASHLRTEEQVTAVSSLFAPRSTLAELIRQRSSSHAYRRSLEDFFPSLSASSTATRRSAT